MEGVPQGWGRLTISGADFVHGTTLPLVGRGRWVSLGRLEPQGLRVFVGGFLLKQTKKHTGSNNKIPLNEHMYTSIQSLFEGFETENRCERKNM